ncbi:MAG TPA: molybdopterin-dependent oxidoreductase [Streptosporangiaceae bacterium]|nr:molybdopterin-dependent oxidoreductase [Streptosporangiaceae bacterium]
MIISYRTRIRGALAGLLAGAVGVCVGFLVAGFTSQVGNPVVAVAEGAIDLSPPAVKNFAIKEFGSHDKLVLQIGVLIVLALLCAVIGMAAQRWESAGLIGFGIFCLVGLVAAGTRPTSTPIDLLPTLAGAAAALFTVSRLVRAAGTIPRIRPPAADRSAGVAAPGGPPAAAKDDAARGADRAAVDRPRRTASLSVTEPPRRAFMKAGATAAGTAAVAFAAGRLLSERANVTVAEQSLKLPPPAVPARPLPAGSNLGIPGLASFVTPNSQFYRVDTAIVLPQIPPSSWQLRIHGMVSRELTLTFDDLIRRPLIEDWVTLTCVSNPVGGPYIGNAKWLGASLRSLLQQAGIKAGADQLFCTSFDGFTSGTPVATAMDGRDAMLAVAMNGKPLPVEHGFPVRSVVPGLYGYVSACKWITDIEVTTYRQNQSYWAQRGWFAQAPIKTESRIDVPSGQSSIKAGRTAIAGVAWAQHKGIDAVHVRVDRGPWQQATLATVPDIDTWRQWVLHWDATPGNHVIEARATDATGYTQTAVQEPPEPNGATGYPIVQVSVA